MLYHWAFFFSDSSTTEIYTLSLHDALPIFVIDIELEPLHVGRTGETATDADGVAVGGEQIPHVQRRPQRHQRQWQSDRKSTRLNSSHLGISYAVFCLKKKKQVSKVQVELLK